MSPMSDKEFYQLTISINKALNPVEAPLKTKHARSIIIMTHRTKEAKSFWTVVTRQPLMEIRFTAWKFCHLLHKVLREGHPSAIKHSQTHKKMILEMGKLWGHLQDGLGTCIQSYTKLIGTKLEFHEKNAIFPGSLLIDFSQIERFAGDDINIYFQLCVEIFDYLDDIIDVQLKVFTSINTYRMSSMSPQGQCKLAPMITLIQDSNPLYDLCVRIMFKLHDKLPNDILAGHRDRFRDLFAKLKSFYNNVRPLQYFADLIQVPNLPDSAPNFSSKIDFGSYVPPVVFVQPDPEPVMDNLIDTSNEQVDNAQMQNTLKEDLSALQYKVHEKDLTIHDLEKQLDNYKECLIAKENIYKNDIMQLRGEVGELSRELATSKELCRNVQLQKDDLELQLTNTPILIQKASAGEDKARASEEKFNKLKTMYTQIRDEHIALLREHSESNKQLNKEKSEITELQQKNAILETQLADLQRDALQEKNQKVELELKYQKLDETYVEVLKSYEQLKQDNENLNITKCLEIEHLMRSKSELEQNIEIRKQDELKIISLKQALDDVNEELQQQKQVHDTNIASYQKDVEEKKDEINKLKGIIEVEFASKDEQLRKMDNNLTLIQTQLKEKELQIAELTNTNSLLDGKYEIIRQENSELKNQLDNAIAETKTVIAAKTESEVKYDNFITSLLGSILEIIEFQLDAKFNETNLGPLEKSIKVIEELIKILNGLQSVYPTDRKNQHSIREMLQKAILLSNYITILHEQCMLIYNTSTDIEKAQDIYNKINSLSMPLLKLLQQLRNADDAKAVVKSISTMESILNELQQLIQGLIEASNTNIELGDLVERELAEMDRAIEEASQKFIELLSSSRSKDDGIKLEVNEKILDACTALMACIKLLIQKSKVLQEEIVSKGKGSTTVKEFYKRNSQWTEGLISASKSVAKGANLLVEAANRAVNSESSKNFEIIVAAQEIAAYTAQLVIASKVKAPKESTKLTDLTKASRNVSQATGVVVATVKDCIQNLEQSQEIDITTLNSSQIKTMEMEIHVKVLELEQSLQSERLKLASFRRKHYKNIDD